MNVEEKFKEYVVCTGIKTSVRDFCLELESQIIDKYGVNTELVFGALPTSADEIMDVNNDCSDLNGIRWKHLSTIKKGIKCLLDGSAPL